MSYEKEFQICFWLIKQLSTNQSSPAVIIILRLVGGYQRNHDHWFNLLKSS